jgi:AcrR family transcriptional regulator
MHQYNCKGGARLRDRIIQSAVRQVKKYGLRRFTIEDITRDLEISKKTIYKYFDSKEEIVDAVCDYLFKVSGDDIDKISAMNAGWQDKLLETFKLAYKEDSFDQQMLSEIMKFYPKQWDKVKKLQCHAAQHVKNLLADGVASGDIKSTIDIDVLEIILDKIIDLLLNTEFLIENDLNLSRVTNVLQQTVFFGILTPECQLRREMEMP